VTRTNVRIRPASRPDVTALVELMRSIDLTAGTFSGVPLRNDDPDHLARRLTELLDTDRILLVATEEAGDVVGLLAARYDSVGAIDLTDVLHVTHLMVHPGHRRRGVARSLLAAVVQLAEDHGVEHVVVTAMSGARESNRYLSRLGFAPLVVHRMAPVSALRRTLGMSDSTGGVAVLRRARIIKAQRMVAAHRGVGRGA
jgi:GNAT superfamily N-acetyltransferase